jgi:recombination protein RecA
MSSSSVSRAKMLSSLCKDLQPRADKDGNLPYSLRMGSEQRAPSFIPSRVLSFDVASGRPGLPTGRAVMLHGDKGCGKTSLMNAMMASVQRRGGLAVLLDNERKHDIRWAALAGVNMDELFWLKPRSIESGMGSIEEFCLKARKVDADVPIIFGLDSLQAGTARKSIEKGIDDLGGYSPESGAYSRAFRMIMPVLDDANAILVCIDQVRLDVGSAQPGKEKHGVGRAIGHHMTWVADLDGTVVRKTKGVPPYVECEAHFVKNQIADPYRKTKFRIDPDTGIDFDGSIFQAARDVGMVEVSGSWFEIDLGGGTSNVRFQGIDGWKTTIAEKPSIKNLVEEAVLDRMESAYQKSETAARLRVQEDAVTRASAAPEELSPQVEDAPAERPRRRRAKE